ncbi:SUMF1/EgtB/PvdO family nonheme iron enzyme [Nannocystis poenicansa]|uniref:SUMF1/EgtB/PvdO family nonheme iron enzyme n=1 Tax=Nannocystis punicea TaxID=2995304 RepID=A0ABY7HJQ7_9BACT|nr:SUMF1/EgtB/PvdO family nonheme iron enzyme [Nannocystis poenicansa]
MHFAGGCRAASRTNTAVDELILIPGGRFLDNHGSIRTVRSFHADAAEVTVAEYSECVAAGHCSGEIRLVSDEFDRCVRAGFCRERHRNVGCNYRKVGRGDHPMNCVGIGHALQYCAWRKMSLPTEWEWEWMARGGDAARRFPWGDELPTCERAVMAQPRAEGSWYGCNADSTWPVGSKPAGKSYHGVMDLAGNVAELVLAEEERLFARRGGSFGQSAPFDFEVYPQTEPAGFSGEFPFSSASSDDGFRCIRRIEQ